MDQFPCCLIIIIGIIIIIIGIITTIITIIIIFAGFYPAVLAEDCTKILGIAADGPVSVAEVFQELRR